MDKQEIGLNLIQNDVLTFYLELLILLRWKKKWINFNSHWDKLPYVE